MKTLIRCLLFVLPALAVPALGLAQQQMLQFGHLGAGAVSTGYVDVLAGLAYTDNALLTQRQHSNDGIGTVGLDLDYARKGRLSLNLLGNIDRVEYIRHSFSGSFYGRFNGNALWGAPSDPVQWLLSDSFGEGMTNPLAAPTPTNLQTVNYFRTGPFLNLNLGLTNRFTVYAQYARSTYQRSPYDSQTYEGGARVTHKLSGATSLSLQASDARTEYLEQTALLNTPGHGSRYNVKQASVKFKGQYVRTNVSLTAGYNTINYGGRTHGSPYYSVQLSRSVSPFSTVFIGGQSSYSTLGGAMQTPTAQLNVQGGGTAGPSYVTSQPFKQRMGTLGWNFHRARTSFSISGTYQQSLYDLQPRDNHRDEMAHLAISRQLQPTVSLRLQLHGSYDHYTELDAKTHQYMATLTLSKQMAHAMFALYVRRIQQSGSPGASGFVAASYHDDQVGVYFTYDLFGQRSTGGASGLPGKGMPGLPGAL